MPTVKRETAKKCRVKDILNGRYVKREGWEPNYMETDMGKISRVNIYGTVISKNNNSLIIDDGTGKLEIRVFDDDKILSGHEIGDLVLIIGRPRVYNENKYLVPEIIKKVDNPKWIEYRMLELKKQGVKETKTQTSPGTPEEEKIEEKKQEQTTAKIDITDALLQKLNELDNGYGVRIEDLVKHFDTVNANRTINKLIEHGDVFEIKPGVIKTI